MIGFFTRNGLPASWGRLTMVVAGLGMAFALTGT